MKALLLCGGEGIRLRPFTHTRPKQLFPLVNKPILFYILDYLADSPIHDVVIVVGPAGKQIQDALGTGENWGLNIQYIEQSQPLGLAHAVLIAKDALGEEPFLMYLGDNLLEEPLSHSIKEFLKTRAAGCSDGMVLVRKVKNPSAFGVAEVERDRVIRVVEKPTEPQSNLALVGAYFFSPEIHASVRNISPSARGELEITDAIQDLINRGKIVNYRRLKGWWKDTGSPVELLNANRILLKQIKPQIQGKVISSHYTGVIRLGKNSVIENCWIKGPVCIGADCHVKDAVLGPFLSVGDRVHLSHTEVKMSILLSDCRVENLFLNESILGEDSRLSAHLHLHKHLEKFRSPLRLIMGPNSLLEL